MSGVGTQPSLRKYLGAIKDSTTLGLANFNSEFKELDIAIVKATNHVERPAKEKHIQAIFSAISAIRPRADVAYCIRALSRRLSKTHNWAVALKTLVVIHRALREVDSTFPEELINYGRSRNHMLNLSHFKDDSAQSAWDYSAWIRTYALYLEEKLECIRVVKYDVETEPVRTRDLDAVDLLDHLPALQQLLFRILNCQPQGAAMHNFVIQLALSMVASESIKVYNAISNGTINMVDKFFDMEPHHAVKALEIYKRAGKQAERLSEFYEICKSIGVRRGEGFIKIELSPASFVTAMEEYVREAPQVNVRKYQTVDNKIEAPKEVLALKYEKAPEVIEPPKIPSPPPEPEKVEVPEPQSESSNLLGLENDTDEVGNHQYNPHATELDKRNALALAIVPVDNLSTEPPPTAENSTTGWELALVTAPSSNENATATSKLAGGLDKLTLDSLYDDASKQANQTINHNPWEMPATAGPYMMHQPMIHDPFYGSNTNFAPNVQMAQQQQQAFILHQQMMMMGPSQPQHAPVNPFGNPNASVGYHQTPSTYTGLL